MVLGSLLASHNLSKLHILFQCGPQVLPHALNPHGSMATFLYWTSTNRALFVAHKRRCSLSSNQGTSAPVSNVGGEVQAQLINEKNISNVQPQTPAQKPSNIPIWKTWVWGTILSLILPFWMTTTMGELHKIEVEVDKVAEVVENVAEVVEKVAVVAEKVSSEVADYLPGDGKLKDTFMLVEHVSKEVAKDAQLTIDFIHKVDEIKQQVENLLEPVIDQQKFKITPHQCHD